jgi:hypothetical protein
MLFIAYTHFHTRESKRLRASGDRITAHGIVMVVRVHAGHSGGLRVACVLGAGNRMRVCCVRRVCGNGGRCSATAKACAMAAATSTTTAAATVACII